MDIAMLSIRTPVDAHHEGMARRIDAAIDVAALLVRGGVYAAVALLAGDHELGRALLTGLVAGDLAASALALALHRRDSAVQTGAEFVLLALVFLWVRSQLAWPDDPAARAIVGLTAFGVFAARAGRAVMTRLGPGENGFA